MKKDLYDSSNAGSPFFKKETNMRERNNLAVSMFSFRCPFCVGIRFPDAD